MWKSIVCRGSVKGGLLLLGLLAVLGRAGDAAAQGAVREDHGDWQIRCDTPPGAPLEQCALIQAVTDQSRENVGLTVIVLQTADAETRLLRILAPLGVLLPSGLGLKIDDTDVGRAGFVRCLANGCVAEVVLDEALLGQLNAGEQAIFIIFQTPEEGIGIPVSLDGFDEGVAALFGVSAAAPAPGAAPATPDATDAPDAPAQDEAAPPAEAPPAAAPPADAPAAEAPADDAPEADAPEEEGGTPEATP